MSASGPTESSAADATKPAAPETAAVAGSAPEQAAITEAPRRKLAGVATVLALATLLSRVLGLLREQVFAALLGAGLYGDAFTMAFRLPNLLRDLFAEGALSAAFQPAFVAEKKTKGRAAAERLANLVLTCLIVVVGVLVVLGIVFAPAMVSTWAKGYADVAGKAELTVLLTRIMMPFLLLVSLAAVAMGMLNAEERFTMPALAPTLFNVAAVVTGIGMWVAGIERTPGATIGWAIATLVGGVLQLGIQLVPLYRDGYRFRFLIDLKDPALRSLLWVMAPATLGLMATQVNIYISSSFASTEDGAVTWLQLAFRLVQLPIGMFGVAAGTVALARFSDSATEADLGKALDGVRDSLRKGLRFVAFTTLPAAVAMWVLADLIVAVIYERRAFSSSDTAMTASALRYYSLGLFAYAAVKVAAPVFYALKTARIPVLASVLTVAVTVLWNFLAHPYYGFRALALGTSIGAAVNLAVLLIAWSRRHGGILRGDFLLSLLRMAVSAVVMGLVMWVMRDALGNKSATPDGITATSFTGSEGHGGWLGLAQLVAIMIVGGGSYAGLSSLMGIEEAGELYRAVRRRLGRRTGTTTTAS